MNKRNILNHRWIKPLVSEAKRLGFKVLLVKDSSLIGIKEAYGCFDREFNRILVVMNDHDGNKLTLSEITWHLAHEVRHAQHFVNGNFSGYYKDDFRCGLEYGLMAEKNCDRFADNYVESLPGYKKPKVYGREYPVEKVSGYGYYKLLALGWKRKQALPYYYINRQLQEGNIWRMEHRSK